MGDGGRGVGVGKQGGGDLRPQRGSFGTRPPANWSGQISHGRLGVVPSLHTGAAVSRAFQMPQHITPGLMERTVHRNKFTHHPQCLSWRDEPDLLTYGYYSPNYLSNLLISLCLSQVLVSPLIPRSTQLCGFTRIHSDFHFSIITRLNMFILVLAHHKNGILNCSADKYYTCKGTRPQISLQCNFSWHDGDEKQCGPMSASVTSFCFPACLAERPSLNCSEIMWAVACWVGQFFFILALVYVVRACFGGRMRGWGSGWIGGSQAMGDGGSLGKGGGGEGGSIASLARPYVVPSLQLPRQWASKF